ncbi:MAG TPA: hypothetical protein VGC11_01955 [Acidimicrobiia bacterium]|jgi:hypothetical protein
MAYTSQAVRIDACPSRLEMTEGTWALGDRTVHCAVADAEPGTKLVGSVFSGDD